MTKMVKKISTIAIVGVMGLMMAVPTFAANTGDTDINQFTVTKYTKYILPRAKQNATSCYVKMNNLHTFNSVMVNVYGQASGDSSGALKFNCNNGVNDRIIKVDQGYLLLNQVYEKGYGYATLGFSRATTTNYLVSGVWSPDSVYEPGLITI